MNRAIENPWVMTVLILAYIFFLTLKSFFLKSLKEFFEGFISLKSSFIVWVVLDKDVQ